MFRMLGRRFNGEFIWTYEFGNMYLSPLNNNASVDVGNWWVPLIVKLSVLVTKSV